MISQRKIIKQMRAEIARLAKGQESVAALDDAIYTLQHGRPPYQGGNHFLEEEIPEELQYKG